MRWRACGQRGTTSTCGCMRHKYRTPPQKRSGLCKSRPYARRHHTARICSRPSSVLLVAQESSADTILVQYSQPNHSPHVAAAAAGEVAGSADLRPSAAAAARHNCTAADAAEADAVQHHQIAAAAAEAAAVTTKLPLLRLRLLLLRLLLPGTTPGYCPGKHRQR